MLGILPGGKDYVTKLTRAQLDNQCSELYRKAIGCAKSAVDKANLTPGQIDVVIPVGGSTRVKKIREMLIEEYGKEKVLSKVDPDLAVAYGATLQAAILNHESEGVVHESNMVLHDICPLSIGLRTKGGEMDKVIPRNTKIPTDVQRKYSTSITNQKSVSFAVS